MFLEFKQIWTERVIILELLSR